MKSKLVQSITSLLPMLLAAALAASTASTGAELKKLQTVPAWGEVIDPDGDCDFAFERGILKISIPGKDHALAQERNQMNAPRVLQEVKGDFVAQVKVSGTFPAGTTSVVGSRRAFQGAGLVLWQDANTYVRLERSQLVVNLLDQPGDTNFVQHTFCYASFELRRGGRFEIAGRTSECPLEGRETQLKLERQGDKLSAWVSPDGAHWTALNPMTVKLPETLQIGVVAGHNTSTPVTAEFEGFTVTHPPVQAVKK